MRKMNDYDVRDSGNSPYSSALQDMVFVVTRLFEQLVDELPLVVGPPVVDYDYDD